MKFDKKVLSEEELSKVNGGVNLMGTEYNSDGLKALWADWEGTSALDNPYVRSTLKAYRNAIFAQFETDSAEMPPTMKTYLNSL